MMWFPLVILLNLVLLTDFLSSQNSCQHGACHPSVGDLLVGRSKQLTASSTCGLFGPQKYCTVGYLEEKKRCFTCDSRRPYHPLFQTNSHSIENVVAGLERDRKKWWQSENGVDHVSIQLNLENMFQFSHLILTFKTFHPAAMLVERSADYGQTWKVYRYFAQNCAASFPDIPSKPAEAVGDLVCDSKYSDIEPSTEGEVIFKVLDPSFEIENVYDPYIQELVAFTNLRINFTKLQVLGDTLLGEKKHNLLENYYYALYEMVVRGSCMCNGHARYCGPGENLRGDVFHQPGMVHGNCLCEHNTDGLSCERCKDFYNDVPWRPAEGSQENACRKCECNSHSETCHFDMAVYLANNRTTGGVCEDCQHNTTGQHCERCKPFFYKDPQKAMTDPHVCIACDCDPEGALQNGLCQSHSDPVLGTIAGQCLCKPNVEGVHCGKCKPHYYGINGSDPLGCQPCRCDSLGSLPFSVCNPESGECVCQEFVTGQRCEHCLEGYWGLGSHAYGCSPCDCDIGGAYNNSCAPTDGQCDCRPHVVGRHCSEPAVGYFFLPLDYYIYEAEDSTPLLGPLPLVQPTAMPRCDVYFQRRGYDFTIENGKIVLKKIKKKGIGKLTAGQNSVPFNRNPALNIVIKEVVPGKPVTWSGLGFVRVRNKAGLRFLINNIPFPMHFNIIIRYEPETSADWRATITVKSSGPVGSEHCTKQVALEEPQSLDLPSIRRIQLLSTPICLQPKTEYFVDVYFTKTSDPEPKSQSSILVDSIGLLPVIASVENFCDPNDLEEYQQYRCVESASEIGPHILAETCAKLIASLSARIHNGAVPCRCHPQGSLNSHCTKLGGQCQCKANVVGRCCDKCAAGSHSFGPQGCLACGCHPQGSVSTLCDQMTGQCPCRSDVAGQQCNRCLAGYFGFPHCRPCACNGLAELCDPQTGVCWNCTRFTTGSNCERCLDGYYGNPLEGKPCRPCMCPDSPTSKRYFAHSCFQDPWTKQLVCKCFAGYSGDRCDECSSGFYGNPRVAPSQCLPCSCNNNTDMADPESCNKDTGECLKCLYNTHGPNCQFCKPGYFGSALLRNCEKCNCNLSGVNPAKCPPGSDFCTCDQTTGQCPCSPHVTGEKCDRCAPGYWNMVQRRGCCPCGCHPKHSINNVCDQLTGQCSCEVGYAGRRCDICAENHYGIDCIECKCHKEGTLTPACDKDTGVCHCRTGVSGERCDRCARNRNQAFPSCSRCHVCFDRWDKVMSSLSRRIQKLLKFAGTLAEKRKATPGCDFNFKGYEKKMSDLGKVLKRPFPSSEVLLNIKKVQDNIRQKVSHMFLQPGPLDQFPDLHRVIENLHKDVDNLSETLQKRKDLHCGMTYLQFQDFFNKIKNYYQITLAAEKRIQGAKSIIAYGGNVRNKVFALLNDLDVKENITLDQLRTFTVSEIEDLNEKVCGMPGNVSCAVAECGGALCHDRQGNKYCGDPNCDGAYPLSINAFRKAERTDLLLSNLINQTQGFQNKIKSIRKMTEDTKEKTLTIHGKLEKNKYQIEKERESMKELIKQLRNFLLEESAPPEDIEKVANYVLGIKMHKGPQELPDLLNNLQSLVTQCEDSTEYIRNLKKPKEEAEKLLKKAKEAEERTKALTAPDEIITDLKEVDDTQRQTKDALATSYEKIEETVSKISKAENQMKKAATELQVFPEKQSKLTEEISSLKTKMETNRIQAAGARSKAKEAQNQAAESNKEFAHLKHEFSNLQGKFLTSGLTLEILQKLSWLKKEAEELAHETAQKAKRITALEKKIQDLNQIKQQKADQLKQLEDHVLAIKNEIAEESNRYAVCKS
ncbi:laminin subunit beta-4 isoform X1 [Crotalus tigris]|uniref:laminin subunit beta-4 isoform X1 n=2 Tax=Crotalus tigris TaxID=88082 RepID=UPI00192FA423|nr:laminin subunit beta-4 isoform X1 [Crotalus tigris]XP_039210426.1 laminin subunit beta-4 isoform X1 [Crotalus tigris]XP_039210427.1 laminin subunit beta-4 isoform X1 [Crotalus tigris]